MVGIVAILLQVALPVDKARVRDAVAVTTVAMLIRFRSILVMFIGFCFMILNL